MKILLAIPGHLKTVPMGRFTADALQELGHQVLLFDYKEQPLDKLHSRLLKPNEEKARVNRRLRQRVDKQRPDLFLTLFGFDISRETLEYIGQQGIPRACWWINDPFQFKRSMNKAAHYDFLFTNAIGSVDDYRAAGIEQAYLLPTACVPAVHRPLPAQPDMACDLCFAGDWSPLRQRVMESLIPSGIQLRIFGPWAKKLPPDSPLHAHLRDGFFTPDEMARMFSSARLVLNIHTWHETSDHGTNPRLFEAAGCGALQLVDWRQEIPDLFAVDDEVLVYQSLDELPARVCEALALSDARQQKIRKAAQQRAYRDHTYVQRMRSLLETVAP